MPEFRPNTLYYGDNLDVLRAFPSESVDLVYLDPPFNSNRSYNVLFREAKGAESEAQIQAFDDTWHWYGEHSTAARTYADVVGRGDDVGRVLKAFVDALGHNDVTAYLTMMAPRLVELRRVMKPTASIYLHCDPTASHYLKVLMDAVFGARNFRNEVIWQRTYAHSDVAQGLRRMGRIHDVLLFYTLSVANTWTPQYTPYSDEYVSAFYSHVEEGTGRRYQLDNLTAAKPGGDTEYEWVSPDGRRVRPYRNRYWAYSRANMEEFERQGRLYYTRTGMPRYKRYLDEMPGVPLQDVWSDIGPIGGSREFMGYRTQKPEALLERIIAASSNEGDLVLDPFCGCGTAVVAAHGLQRQWIGIDVTFLAVNLMRRRLEDRFAGDFPDGVQIEGAPADEAGALALAESAPFQFQFWVVDKLGGVPRGGENRRGPDRGIDGVLPFPERDPNDPERPTLDFREAIVSVKAGHTGPAHVRELRGVVEREASAEIGVLVTAHEPTRQMREEAASAGLYTSAWTNASYPRIQILTAGEIIHGKRIEMPSQMGTSGFARAPRARRGRQPRLEL